MIPKNSMIPKYDSLREAFALANRVVFRCYAIMLAKESLDSCERIPIVTNSPEKFENLKEVLIGNRKITIGIFDITKKTEGLPVGGPFFQELIARSSLYEKHAVYVADEELLTQFILGKILYDRTNGFREFESLEIAMAARVMKQRLAID